MNGQDSMSSIKPTRLVEWFFHANCLEELQEPKFERTIINFIKEFIELKENISKYFIDGTPRV